MPRPDKHNEIEFNLLKAGSLTYLLGGHRIMCAAVEKCSTSDVVKV